MKRSNVDEKRIQCTAIHYLHHYYYTPKFPASAFYVNAEEYTTDMRNRADGLIVIDTKQADPYVISLEAKSMKLIREVRIKDSIFKYFTSALVAALLISGMGLWLGWALAWYWLVLIGLLGFAAGFLIYAAVAESFLHWFLESKVVSQVKRYPGHEQWIAVPASAFDELTKLKHADDFRKLCKQKQVGLLTVNQRGRVEIVENPRTAQTSRKMLNHYKNSDKIKSALLSKEAAENQSYKKCNDWVTAKKIIHYTSQGAKS